MTKIVAMISLPIVVAVLCVCVSSLPVGDVCVEDDKTSNSGN